MSLQVGTIASPLGDWTFARYGPPAGDPIAATLVSAWYFDGVLAHRRERVFPKGTHGLIVQLDEPHRTPAGERFPQLVYTGMNTRATVVEAPNARTRVIGVELTAAGGFALAGHAVGEAIDQDVDLRALFGSAADALLEACRAERSPATILLRAVRFCALRGAYTQRCAPSVRAAIAMIERSRGRVRMRDLAAGLGRGERALERAFRDRVGLVPKRYARIARFAHAHELLATSAMPLADVAERAGFYDQAHFNADFREHAGLSPTAYLASLRYPGSLSLAEPD